MALGQMTGGKAFPLNAEIVENPRSSARPVLGDAARKCR